MIDPVAFHQALKSLGINFYTGVPDSLLKSLCAVIQDNTQQEDHIIAANEGAALALGVGYHLATDELPLVYLQNSGLGNVVNPLLSLAAEEVYSIPMLLVIGWRGEPNVKDEPQHLKQGLVTEALLKSLDVPYIILDEGSADYAEQLDNCINAAKENQRPHAILIRKNTFAPYSLKSKANQQCEFSMTREEVIQYVANRCDEDEIIVATTGAASRELYESRWTNDKKVGTDFYTVGGMGHASQIALGIAIKKPNRQIICLDGDGAALMHMGSLAIAANQNVKNFKHIILNNGCHDSVGGQPTVGFGIDFCQIAKGCGYAYTARATNLDELSSIFTQFMQQQSPALLEIYVKPGMRKDLMRPKTSAVENKKSFMRYLESCEHLLVPTA